MHLAFLTPEYPHPQSTPSGGLGTSIKNLAEQLAKRGHRISVFIYGQEEEMVFEDEGISFHFIKQLNYDFFGWYRYRKYLEFYLNKIILEENIEALEAPDWTGITAFMKLKCPLMIRMHGSDAYFCKLEGRAQKKKNFWFEKLALKGADHLLAVSEFTAQKTAEIFGLKQHIKIIPNSVDVQLFVPQHKGLQPGDILYFGSLIRKKGMLELPKIFNIVVKKNPLVRLKLAGRDVTDIKTGKSTKDLMQDKFSPAAKLQVEWLGNLPYEEILEEIAKAHVVVLPSFAEALPMTWLEAMAMEKALVTSDIGWAKEVMVNGETGYTVDPKDHRVYAKKVLELLMDSNLKEKMGKAARKQVIKKFSTEVVVEENILFYEMVIR